MPDVHYTISPSQLSRWRACPASFQEERKYPDKPAGPAAIDGTHSHTLLEKCLEDGIKDPILFLGETLEDHEGTFEVEMDRISRVKVAVDYVQRRKAELGICAIRTEDESDPGKALGWDDWKGTCDITLIGETK